MAKDHQKERELLKLKVKSYSGSIRNEDEDSMLCPLSWDMVKASSLYRKVAIAVFMSSLNLVSCVFEEHRQKNSCCTKVVEELCT